MYRVLMSPVWIREPGALEIPSGHCHSSPSSSEAASTMSFTGLHAVTMVASGLKGWFVFFPRGSSGIYRDVSCVSLLPTCATMLMLMICLPVVIVKDARNIWNYVWCSLSLAVAWSLLWWWFTCFFSVGRSLTRICHLPMFVLETQAHVWIFKS